MWTTAAVFAAPTSSCLGLSRILRLSRGSLIQAMCPCVCVQAYHCSHLSSSTTPAQPRGSEHGGSGRTAALSCAVPGQPKRGRHEGTEAVGASLMLSPPRRARWNEDQGEQGNFGVPNHMFPQSKVRWLKNKGAIKEHPFSQGSLAHRSCKHGTQ